MVPLVGNLMHWLTSISSFRPLYIYTYLHLMCIIQYKTLYKNYKNTITHKVSGEYSLEEDGFNQAQKTTTYFAGLV